MSGLTWVFMTLMYATIFTGVIRAMRGKMNFQRGLLCLAGGFGLACWITVLVGVVNG